MCQSPLEADDTGAFPQRTQGAGSCVPLRGPARESGAYRAMGPGTVTAQGEKQAGDQDKLFSPHRSNVRRVLPWQGAVKAPVPFGCNRKPSSNWF